MVCLELAYIPNPPKVAPSGSPPYQSSGSRRLGRTVGAKYHGSHGRTDESIDPRLTSRGPACDRPGNLVSLTQNVSLQPLGITGILYDEQSPPCCCLRAKAGLVCYSPSGIAPSELKAMWVLFCRSTSKLEIEVPRSIFSQATLPPHPSAPRSRSFLSRTNRATTYVGQPPASGGHSVQHRISDR